MNDQAIALKGREAAQVLDNASYKQAMQTLRDAVVNQWKECPVRDKEGALLLLQLAKLADKFEGILSGIVQNGKMAQSKIDLDSLRDESRPRQFMRKVVNG